MIADVEPGAEAKTAIRRAPARRPRDRRDMILAAAAELFAERGFAAVGVADIAERVGITGGAIYRHFPSKDAVLEAVTLATAQAFVGASRVGKLSRSADDPEDALRRMVTDVLTLMFDRPAHLATYLRERHRLNTKRRRELARHEGRMFELWAEAMLAARPDLDRARIAVRQQALNGAVSAIALRRASLPRPRLQELLGEAGVAVLLAPTRPTQVEVPHAGAAWSPPRSRRDLILGAALRLFRERGFHGAGMDDIGEAAAISGPAIYASYGSKTDILLDAFDRAAARVAVGAENALAVAGSAPDALRRLARSYVEVAFDNVDLLLVTSREGHALPEEERPRLSRRRRGYRDTWAAVLREARAELSDAESRTLVAGVFPLVNQVAQHRRDDSPTVDEVVDLVEAFVLGNQHAHQP
jgi:AcrR family transcriptional regulator